MAGPATAGDGPAALRAFVRRLNLTSCWLLADPDDDVRAACWERADVALVPGPAAPAADVAATVAAFGTHLLARGEPGETAAAAAPTDAPPRALAVALDCSRACSTGIRSPARAGAGYEVAGIHHADGAGSSVAPSTTADPFATRLAGRGHQVEVVTSCATDAATWSDVLPPGTTVDDGVVVHRLPAARPATPSGSTT